MSTQREQMIKFFTELDGLLDEAVELTVIGGTAMVLGYESERMTHDCDPFGKLEEKLIRIWKEAQEKSGIKLSIDTSTGIAQMPEGFEDRLVNADLKLKKLVIRYPDKYDLVLSKVSRLLGNDMDDIVWIYKAHGLEMTILLGRYKNEFRPIYIGKQRTLDLNFFDGIEELYGKEARDKIEKSEF